MTTNEIPTPAAPEAETLRLPEPLNITDSHEKTDEIPAGAPVAYLVLIQHHSHQYIVGVALDQAEAEQFVRLSNRGRFGEQAVVVPVELLSLPALWKR